MPRFSIQMQFSFVVEMLYTKAATLVGSLGGKTHSIPLQCMARHWLLLCFAVVRCRGLRQTLLKV